MITQTGIAAVAEFLLIMAFLVKGLGLLAQGHKQDGLAYVGGAMGMAVLLWILLS